MLYTLLLVSYLIFELPVVKADDIILKLNSPDVVNLSPATRYKYKSVLLQSYKNTFPAFIIAQIHAQKTTVVSSFTQFSKYGYGQNATDSGIMKMIYSKSSSRLGQIFVGVDSNKLTETDALILAVSYSSMSPIPGACCLTCALETDPNINITYSQYKTVVSFHRGNYYLQPICDGVGQPKTYSLVYDIYYYYLQYNDFTESGFFNGLMKMATVEAILENGLHLKTLSDVDKLALNLESVSGQGVIFNVIVTDVYGGRSAYVPAVTYACDLHAAECNTGAPVYVVVTLIIYGILGIVMLFAGLKLFRLLLFVCGTLFWWMMIYITMANLVNVKPEELFLISCMTSLIGGGLTLLLYMWKRLIYLCLLVVEVMTGMCIAAIAFYTPLGYFALWNQVYNFALGFAAFTLVVVIVLLFCPKVACYISSSLLGSYAIILVASFFLNANMQYIIFTVILRFTVPDFGTLYLRRPFQVTDYILSAAWFIIFLLGIIVQHCTMKGKDFEVSGKKMRKKAWQTLSESVGRGRQKKQTKLEVYKPANVQTPLLTDNNFASYTNPGTSAPPLHVETQPSVNPYWLENPQHMTSFQPSAPPVYGEDPKVI